MSKTVVSFTIRTPKDTKVSRKNITEWVKGQLPESAKIGDVEISLSAPKVVDG